MLRPSLFLVIFVLACCASCGLTAPDCSCVGEPIHGCEQECAGSTSSSNPATSASVSAASVVDGAGGGTASVVDGAGGGAGGAE